MTRARKNQVTMTWQQFTQLYMESWKAGHTYKEFARRCGLTARQVHGKAGYLRRRGVKLPPLRHSAGGCTGSSFDADLLQSIVEDALTSPASNGRVLV